MAISASTVTTTDTLETFRVEFNNLVADVLVFNKSVRLT